MLGAKLLNQSPFFSVALAVILPACTASIDIDVDAKADDDTSAGDEAGSSGSESGSDTGLPPGWECSTFDDQCGPGEKCNPWANDGGSAWNALKCVPADGGDLPGEPCQVEGSGVSGVDSCVAGAMCWNVDQQTNIGTCVAHCEGSPANPFCADPQTACVTANNGVLNLCIPRCDPLLQGCPANEACLEATGSGFVCYPVVNFVPLGEPCEFLNECEAGLACRDGVPGCGAQGCCTPFCDLTDPGSSTMCDAFLPTAECVQYYPDGEAPPGDEDVGICVTP